MDYYAIGQCTPGISAINTATFVGYKRKGIPGGIVATLGMAFPSVVIITIIAALVSNFQDLQVVQWAFGGIRAAVVALILSSVIKLMKKSVIDIPTVLMFIAVAVLSTVTSVSPVVFVLIAGVLGILLKGGNKS